MYSCKFPREHRITHLKNITGLKTLNGLKICDWGGNHGNLLLDGLECNEIAEEDYTCIDVDEKVLSESKQQFPSAEWIVRPVTHPVYNTHSADCDVDFSVYENKFDVLYAYSVYTHDTHEKLFADLNIMYSIIKPGGFMCFTYINQYNVSVFVEKRKQDYGHAVN